MDLHRLIRQIARDPWPLVDALLPPDAVPADDARAAADIVRGAATSVLSGKMRPEDFSALVDSLVARPRIAEDLLFLFEASAADDIPKLPSRLIDERTAAEILPEVASRYTRLRRVGTRWVGLCPLHQEKHPSFVVYPDGHFHCFGCGRHGGLAVLVAEVEGISRKEAVRRIAEEFGIRPPRRK